ncbi:MAG: autoinducer binding domain-containing protein [Nitratireductor sp.]|nr:autoinducer binding domain-containing protein [Nitratireductor sp.]
MIEDATTGYDLFRVIKKITTEFGYKAFIAMRLPALGDERIADLAIVTNWDPELIRAYDSMSLICHSPIVQALRQSVLPICWDIETINANRSDDKKDVVIELFREFGHVRGIYFSVSDKHGNRGAFGFSGDRPPPDHNEKMMLSYLTSHAFEHLIRNEVSSSSAKEMLTERERDCIQWTAAGKTSAEVASILEISENTVNHYLSTASLKLNTVNKAHTVARAIRLGLITT